MFSEDISRDSVGKIGLTIWLDFKRRLEESRNFIIIFKDIWYLQIIYNQWHKSLKHPPLLPLFNVAWCCERLSSSTWLKLFYNIVLWETDGDTIEETLFQQSDTDCIERKRLESGSGRVFSGSGIWPKYGAGFGKTKNILTGFWIWLLPGKRDSPKFGHGMRDFVACLSEIREIVTTQINVIAAKANQPGEHKVSMTRANLHLKFNSFCWN